MTAATRPIPDHGTYARGNGAPGYREPCRCTPCWKAMRRGRKQYNVNRQLGRPARVDATPVRQHLQILRRTMTWQQIGTASGGNPRNLQLIHDGRQNKVNRSTLNQVLAVQPQAVSAPGMYVDATGTRRRIQALRALGYSSRLIADTAGSAEVRIQLISSGAQPTVRHNLAAKILTAYAELSDTPAPAGRSATRAKNHAISQGWALPAAWDDIDDPNAVPDWTGHCGTDRGWWTHRQNDIPVCQACESAHAEWRAGLTGLSHREVLQAMATARAGASNRGANIAHDGRELMRLGCDYDTAAERIGVTRQHLQQELQRHPEQMETAA